MSADKNAAKEQLKISLGRLYSDLLSLQHVGYINSQCWEFVMFSFKSLAKMINALLDTKP